MAVRRPVPSEGGLTRREAIRALAGPLRPLPCAAPLLDGLTHPTPA